METNFQYNDGGRSKAGYKGTAGDCVCRAICIVTGKPYQEVYDALANGNATQRQSKYHKAKDGVRTASRGINVRRKWFKEYMESIGFTWTSTMLIGQGCKVHLNSKELPKGRLVVSVSKHYTAVIDGVINDIYNPSERSTTVYPLDYPKAELPKGAVLLENGNGWGYSPERCVYGYYTYNGPTKEVAPVKEVTVIEKPSKSEAKLKKLLTTQKKWQSKLKRAENALKKISKQVKYYESKNK